MARWRLREGHYLNVPGTEWMYEETDRETGKRLRKIFAVPLHLDPNNPTDQNYPGEVIVTNKFDRAFPRDVQFTGDPTPNMEPIDDEAQEISQKFIDSGAWKHPIDALNMTYSQSILSEFEQAIVKQTVDKIQIQAPNVSTGGVSQKQFDELQGMVKQLMEQNASLQAQVLEKKAGRRV